MSISDEQAQEQVDLTEAVSKQSLLNKSRKSVAASILLLVMSFFAFALVIVSFLNIVFRPDDDRIGSSLSALLFSAIMFGCIALYVNSVLKHIELVIELNAAKNSE